MQEGQEEREADASERKAKQPKTSKPSRPQKRKSPEPEHEAEPKAEASAGKGRRWRPRKCKIQGQEQEQVRVNFHHEMWCRHQRQVAALGVHTRSGECGTWLHGTCKKNRVISHAHLLVACFCCFCLVQPIFLTSDPETRSVQVSTFVIFALRYFHARHSGPYREGPADCEEIRNGGLRPRFFLLLYVFSSLGTSSVSRFLRSSWSKTQWLPR